MDPSKRNNALSNSSMIELKAELLKKKKEFGESKEQAKRKVPFSVKQPQKPSSSLNCEDPKMDTKVPEDILKKSQETLKAKARLYSRLEKGKLLESDLNTAQRENLLVDFAFKGWNPEKEEFDFKSDDSEDSQSDNDSSEKKLIGIDQVFASISDSNSQDPDRWIEYEDEFGRTRVSKISELIQIQAERQEIAQFREKESIRRQDTYHYDGDAEIRNKGVGFYQFAADEAERQRQMSELKKLRSETLEKRMRSLLFKEQRRLRIESRLQKLKERKGHDVE